ncbi:MAG TPA: FAD-dependent oxidoreductase [Rhizomicrobium sp.]|nr:FAD-dependent oxidoreductase [Rhizomicrobium sp.]
MSRQTDVVIGGGGMVGATLALALAQGGLKVIVVDPVPPAAATDAKFDGRVSALSYSSQRMYEALGVWPRLAKNAQPILDILVTDAPLGRAPSPFSLHFDSDEIGRPMGAIAENRHIRRSLFEVLDAEKNITLIAPAAMTGLEDEGGRIVASLSNGEKISASLAVAADGRESPIREEMGIGIIGWSYPQWGIVATVEHEKPHEGVAYEHFLPSGPFAILPMTGNRSSLVWTEKETVAPAMLKLPEDEFNAEIAKRFGDHLGATKAAGPRWSYPLKFHMARGFVKSRFALAGDSAHGIHPIAGQGLNLGLKDAAALAETLLDAARLGLDIGTLDVLKRYERWRRFDSVTMGFTMDAFNRLFSNDIAPLRIARDIGLGVVDQIAPLRRLFMRTAGGDIGKLPRLLKGEAA